MVACSCPCPAHPPCIILADKKNVACTVGITATYRNNQTRGAAKKNSSMLRFQKASCNSSRLVAMPTIHFRLFRNDRFLRYTRHALPSQPLNPLPDRHSPPHIPPYPTHERLPPPHAHLLSLPMVLLLERKNQLEKSTAQHCFPSRVLPRYHATGGQHKFLGSNMSSRSHPKHDFVRATRSALLCTTNR